MSIKRTFEIGEECVYFKMYIRSFFADRILIKLSELISIKIHNGEVQKWFFIRYNDPDFHIRVRIFLADKKEFADIIFEVNTLLKEEIETKITTIILDTYTREIERYDALCMELMEDLFYLDTVFLIKFLEEIENSQYTENDRWMYGLIAIDKTLSDFELNLEAKLNFVKNNNELFSKELEKDKNLNKQLNAVYRENEFLIKNNLNNSTELSNFFKQKPKEINILISKINDLNEKSLLTQDFYSLISSYIHMNCNRLFRIEPRKQEYILYDFLTRFYTKEFYRKK